MPRVNDEHMPSPIEALCAENRKLHQQRAELLEALKIARIELESWAEADGLDPYNNPRINDAITKAEAAE